MNLEKIQDALWEMVQRAEKAHHAAMDAGDLDSTEEDNCRYAHRQLLAAFKAVQLVTEDPPKTLDLGSLSC